MHSDEAADACLLLLNLSDTQLDEILANEEISPVVNIGCGEDLTIRELAGLIARIVGFNRRLVFDTSKRDGTPRRRL